MVEASPNKTYETEDYWWNNMKLEARPKSIGEVSRPRWTRDFSSLRGAVFTPKDDPATFGASDEKREVRNDGKRSAANRERITVRKRPPVSSREFAKVTEMMFDHGGSSRSGPNEEMSYRKLPDTTQPRHHESILKKPGNESRRSSKLLTFVDDEASKSSSSSGTFSYPSEHRRNRFSRPYDPQDKCPGCDFTLSLDESSSEEEPEPRWKFRKSKGNAVRPGPINHPQLCRNGDGNCYCCCNHQRMRQGNTPPWVIVILSLVLIIIVSLVLS